MSIYFSCLLSMGKLLWNVKPLTTLTVAVWVKWALNILRLQHLKLVWFLWSWRVRTGSDRCFTPCVHVLSLLTFHINSVNWALVSFLGLELFCLGFLFGWIWGFYDIVLWYSWYHIWQYLTWLGCYSSSPLSLQSIGADWHVCFWWNG